ncbi:hypothetical protein KPH14_010727 [Odynerus spinipes]|uniref:Uncharacterized protein n=1 Tax=Odynerus spinipes TaxID=1348599 RepID=A0AAD9RUZ1_9HYME|nr:hypothetical protein KPH14_010727 [Odynerus spinipes]
MLSRNVDTTVKLVAQILRTHRKYNNVTGVRCFTTFKDTAINYLEEMLKTRVCVKGTLPDAQKSAIQNSAVSTSSGYTKYIMPLTDLEQIKKRKTLDALTDVIYKQHLYTLIHTINNIDAQCCFLLDVMSYYDIFKLLLFFAKTVPAKITRMSFYNKAIELLQEGISNKVFNNNEIVFCLYFFGLKKVNAASEIRMIFKYLEFDKLLLYEKCIVAETTFKCRVKLLQTQIEDIEKLIESKAEVLVADTSLLVPLCKVLRYAGSTQNFLPNNLNKEIVNKRVQYQMIPAVHILKMYADKYLAEPTVLQRLVTDIMARISLANQEFNNRRGLYRSQIYEPKYLDRFLWSVCILNHKLTDVQLLEIRTFIDSMQFNLFNEPQRLLRIILSLWILGYRAEFMIQECIKKKTFLKAYNSKLWKFRTLLCLLFHVIQIESPNIKLPMDLFPDIHVTLNIPKSVRTVSEIISGLAKKMKLQNVIINSPVAGIYIAGVSFDHPTLGSFHVDVLNDITCLQFQQIPHGLTNLKLRLLQQLGYQSILIVEDDVKDILTAFVYIEKRLNEIMYAK